MKLLSKLYKILSPTWQEDKMSEFICGYLDNLCIDYSMTGLQIHKIKPNQPLVCAHMDQSGMKQVKELTILEDLMWGDASIGANDKNGIWICLKLIEIFPEIGFIFSTGTGEGCDIDELLEEYDAELLDSVLYGLVFDRKGANDIIGCNNHYCMPDLQDDITRIGRPMKYYPSIGVFSDADMIAYYDIPCVNISVAFYQDSTDAEFTDLQELARTLLLGKRILLLCNKLYKRTDYFMKNKEKAVEKTPYARKEFPTQNEFPVEFDEMSKMLEEDDDELVYYCTTCQAELTMWEVTSSYLCKECWGEVQSLDDYEFYSNHHSRGLSNDPLQNYSGASAYDDKFERSTGHIVGEHPKDKNYTSLFYCPVCTEFVDPDNDGCPKCKATLLKSASYSGA